MTTRDFRSNPAPCPSRTPCFKLVGEGCHQGMVGLHCAAYPVGLVVEDTCVERLQEFTLNNVDDSAEIDIQLLSLSLVSESPVSVVCGGNPRAFDIYVTRDLSAPIQPPGRATFTRTGNDTVGMDMTALTALRVCPRIEFRPIEGGSSEFDSPGCDYLSTTARWNLEVTIMPSLTSWGVLVLGLLLMATTAWGSTGARCQSNMAQRLHQSTSDVET